MIGLLNAAAIGNNTPSHARSGIDVEIEIEFSFELQDTRKG